MSKPEALGPYAVVFLTIALGSSSAQSYLSGTDEVQQALAKSQVLGSALMIAAHPDDENTAVLAWLARGRHIRTGYLSLTRGEGGQNLIGPEQGDALGVIRTEELLDARRIDGAEQFFTRAVDFGFSKSPKEAIAKWGHDEILSDIVWVIRRFQPDVVILRFTGTPQDGHGHHQASAILGREAYDAAGDPTRFPEQLKWVKPWHAKRLVWNAFSFTPEQEKKVQAMPNRIQVDTGAFDPVIGKSFGEIAGLSRSQHRSQGMGVALERGKSMSYFTPVKGDPPQKDLFDGIDTSWNRLRGGADISELLAQAQRGFSADHPERVLPILVHARRLVASRADSNEPWAQVKLDEINHLLALCSGLWLDAAADTNSVVPGGSVKVKLTALKRLPCEVKWNGCVITGANENEQLKADAALGDDQPLTKEVTIKIPGDAAYSQPFWLVEPRTGDRYVIKDHLLIGRAAPLPVLTAKMDLNIAGAHVQLDEPVHFRYIDHVRGELTRPLEIVPPIAVDLPERAVIFPNGEHREITVRVRANSTAAKGSLDLEAPAGWTVKTNNLPFQVAALGDEQDVTFDVTPPPGSDQRAAFRAVADVGGRKIATGIQSIDYEHIPPKLLFPPATGALQPESLHVLAHNVGYVMGAGDRVPDGLRQMGLNVTMLSGGDLMDGDLSRYDAIVIGVRAYNVRPDLSAAQQRLLSYVRDGGTIVVQYNVLEFARFGDKPAQPGVLAPYPLQISHDRVVEEDSPITLTQATSPLLNAPNRIDPADFKGWIQERGLYFADKWDSHYLTVIATHDEGEKDLPGGILYAPYGKGAYVFTAYSWFRELPAGVPGAYRIFANLLSAGKTLNATASKAELSGSTAH